MAFTEDVFGSKPKVAMFKPLKYGAEQKLAIGGDIAAMPDISQLGDLYKSYLTDQMNSLLPGYSKLLETGVQTAQQELDLSKSFMAGQMPQGIIDELQRTGAFQAMQGGFAGSGLAAYNQANLTADKTAQYMALGAQLAQQGGSAAQRWAGLASADVLNPGAFFVSPQQQANFDLQNRVLRQQSLQNKYNVAAAPDPTAKGVSDTIINLIGAYLGGGRGGGGGTAAQGTTPYASTNYNYSMDQGDPYGSADYSSLGLGFGGA